MDEEMFYRVEPQRIRDEIILILKEKEPLRSLRRMAELHELRFIHPKIRLDRDLIRFYNSIERTCGWYEDSGSDRRSIDRWLMYLAALLDRLAYAEARGLCGRYVFKRGETLRVLSYKKDGRRIADMLRSRRALKPSRIYALLEDLSYEVILLITSRADSPVVTKRVREFIARYNGTKISLRGDDLKALGLKPGPRFSKILRLVLYRKIDGMLKTRKDELEYARRFLS